MNRRNIKNRLHAFFITKCIGQHDKSNNYKLDCRAVSNDSAPAAGVTQVIVP